jgi:hypothetical protein
MNSWWERASIEQRLAQIDGGIELGMTALQVAMASGFRDGIAVGAFANNHSRFFGRASKNTSRNRAADIKKSAKWAYDHGERVDFWSDRPRDVMDDVPIVDEAA